MTTEPQVKKAAREPWPKKPKFTAQEAHRLKEFAYKQLGGWSLLNAMAKIGRRKPRLNYMDELDVAFRFYGAVRPPEGMDVLMNGLTIRKEGNAESLEEDTYTLIFDRFTRVIFSGPRYYKVPASEIKAMFYDATGVWLELES